jgi:hypothetical protein
LSPAPLSATRGAKRRSSLFSLFVYQAIIINVFNEFVEWSERKNTQQKHKQLNFYSYEQVDF